LLLSPKEYQVCSIAQSFSSTYWRVRITKYIGSSSIVGFHIQKMIERKKTTCTKGTEQGIPLYLAMLASGHCTARIDYLFVWFLRFGLFVSNSEKLYRKIVNLKQNVHQVYWLYTYTHRASIQPLHKIEYSTIVCTNENCAHREIPNILCLFSFRFQAIFQSWKLLTR